MTKGSTESAEYQRGREEMKSEVLAALKRGLARDTGYDEHERGEGCSQCDDWYKAIDVAEGCEA